MTYTALYSCDKCGHKCAVGITLLAPMPPEGLRNKMDCPFLLTPDWDLTELYNDEGE